MSSQSTRVLRKRTSKSGGDVVLDEKSPQKKSLNPLCCKLCGHRFSSEIKLFTHMFMHDGPTSKSRSRFQEDKVNHPPRKRPFKCDTCDSAFSQESTLQLHLLSHKSEKFSCETCSAEFPNLGSLQKHSLVEHPAPPKKSTWVNKNKKPRKRKPILRESEYPKKPEIVPDPSDKDEDIDEFRKRCFRHVGRKMFSCEHCGMFFCIENNLKKHLLMHDHTQTALKKRNTYVKRLDPFEAASSSSQNQYVMQESDEDEDENSEFLNVEPMLECELGDCEPQQQTRAKEPLVCKVCNRTFSRKPNLKRHLMTHVKNIYANALN